MTADMVIYAVGSGRGHFVRGRTMQRMLQDAGCSVLLAMRRGADAGFPEDDAVRCRIPCAGRPGELDGISAHTLIVDTFPFGWQGELPPKILLRFRRRVFVARHRHGLDWSAVHAAYTDVVAPYPEVFNEWTRLPAGVRTVGYLLRDDPPRFEHQAQELLIVDVERRAPPAFVASAVRRAERAGFRTTYVTELAPDLAGAKLLIVGAGYNLFYETLRAGADALFVPVRKRYDDQLRRSAVFGRALLDFSRFEDWLRADNSARCRKDSENVSRGTCSTIAAALQ